MLKFAKDCVIDDTGVNKMLSTTLKNLLDEKEMKYEELAEQAGIPLETMRNLYYGKVKDPKASTLLAISRVLNVTVNYLLGEEFISPDESRLISHYRKCGRHGKSVMQLVGKYESAMAISERKANDKHKIPCMIPLGHVVDSFKYGSSETIQIETNVPEAFLAFEVTNNNYLPTYCKGDRILLADRFPEHGERAMFMVDGKVYLRQFIERYSRYILKSFNSQGQHIEVVRMNEVQCIGTVIGVMND